MAAAPTDLTALLQAAITSAASGRELERCETLPGYLSSLFSAIGASGGDSAAPVPLRQMAAIAAKQMIRRHWGGGHASRGHVPLADERATVRQNLLALLEAEPHPRVAAQLNLIVAQIARCDFPRDWPDLFPSMLVRIQTVTSELSRVPSASLDVSPLSPWGRLVRLIRGMHAVTKELSTKRLPADRRRMSSLSCDLLPCCTQLWSVLAPACQGVPDALVACSGNSGKGHHGSLQQVAEYGVVVFGALKTTSKLLSLLLGCGPHSLVMAPPGQAATRALGAGMASLLQQGPALAAAASQGGLCRTDAPQRLCDVHHRAVVRVAEAMLVLGKAHPLTLASTGALRACAALFSSSLACCARALHHRGETTGRNHHEGGSHDDDESEDAEESPGGGTLPIPERALIHGLTFLVSVLDAAQALRPVLPALQSPSTLQVRDDAAALHAVLDRLESPDAGARGEDKAEGAHRLHSARELVSLATELFGPSTHGDWLRLCVTCCFPATPPDLGEWTHDNEGAALRSSNEARGASLRGAAEALLLSLVSDDASAVHLCGAVLAHATASLQGFAEAVAAFVGAAEGAQSSSGGTSSGPGPDAVLVRHAARRLLRATLAGESACRAAGLAAADAIAVGVLTPDAWSAAWVSSIAPVLATAGLPFASHPVLAATLVQGGGDAQRVTAARQALGACAALPSALRDERLQSVRDSLWPAITLLHTRVVWFVSCSLAALSPPVRGAIPLLATLLIGEVPKEGGEATAASIRSVPLPMPLPAGVKLACASLLTVVIQNASQSDAHGLTSLQFLVDITTAVIRALGAAKEPETARLLCAAVGSVLAHADATHSPSTGVSALAAAADPLMNVLCEAWGASRGSGDTFHTVHGALDPRSVLHSSIARQQLLALAARVARSAAVALADRQAGSILGGGTADPLPFGLPLFEKGLGMASDALQHGASSGTPRTATGGMHSQPQEDETPLLCGDALFLLHSSLLCITASPTLLSPDTASQVIASVLHLAHRVACMRPQDVVSEHTRALADVVTALVVLSGACLHGGLSSLHPANVLLTTAVGTNSGAGSVASFPAVAAVLRSLYLASPPQSIASVAASAEGVLLLARNVFSGANHGAAHGWVQTVTPLLQVCFLSCALGASAARERSEDEDNDDYIHIDVSGSEEERPTRGKFTIQGLPILSDAVRRRLVLTRVCVPALLLLQPLTGAPLSGAASSLATPNEAVQTIESWLTHQPHEASAAGAAQPAAASFAVLQQPRPLELATRLGFLPAGLSLRHPHSQEDRVVCVPAHDVLAALPSPVVSRLVAVGACNWLADALVDAVPDLGSSGETAATGDGALALLSRLETLHGATASLDAAATLLFPGSAAGLLDVAAYLAGVPAPPAAQLLACLPLTSAWNPFAPEPARADVCLACARDVTAAYRRLLTAVAPGHEQALLARCYAALRERGAPGAHAADEEEGEWEEPHTAAPRRHGCPVGGGLDDPEGEEDGHLRGRRPRVSGGDGPALLRGPEGDDGDDDAAHAGLAEEDGEAAAVAAARGRLALRFLSGRHVLQLLPTLPSRAGPDGDALATVRRGLTSCASLFSGILTSGAAHPDCRTLARAMHASLTAQAAQHQ